MSLLKRACSLKRYEITKKDLPLSCPTRHMRLWDAHPRVYLPIEKTGEIVCPYCEAEYFLILSKDLLYLQQTSFEILFNLINEVKGMLISLISKVRS